MATKILTVTGSINDNFLYCEDCNQEYDGDCPKHGHLVIVNDAEVPSNCPRYADLGYSRATLPEGLCIKKSRIPKAGLGVFALKDFTARTRFGPFQGREETSHEVAQESGYCVQVLNDGKHSHYLDGKKPNESNWMRFVNCARSEDEQCVTAYQYKGEIYFRAHRHIFAGNEILVYYGDSYAKELGIRTQRVGNFNRRPLNTEELNKTDTCEEGFSKYKGEIDVASNVQMENSSDKLRGRPREALKRPLTREAKKTDIDSHAKIEKLDENGDAKRDTLQASPL